MKPEAKKHFEDLKKKYDIISDVRGRGLLLALEFDKDISMDILTACLKGGLLVNPLKPNTLRFMPPLVLTSAEIDKAVEILDRAISEVAA